MSLIKLIVSMLDTYLFQIEIILGILLLFNVVRWFFRCDKNESSLYPYEHGDGDRIWFEVTKEN